MPARFALFLLLGVIAAAGATLGLAHALSGHALLTLAPVLLPAALLAVLVLQRARRRR